MAKLLFRNFLNDPSEYQQAESIWRDLWKKVVREVGQEEKWQTPWMNTFFNDGSPFRDGNPIFTAVCPGRHLGVRVIQLEPEDDPNELAVWTDTFGEGEPDAIRQLVIDCVLSDETLRDAEALMKQWLTEETVGQSRRAS